MYPVAIISICLLMLLLGGYLAYGALLALRTGVANAGGVIHKRRVRPVRFWLTVAVQSGFAVLCFYQLIAGVGRLLR